MEAMVQEWNDDRLDVLSEKVALGFKHVDERFVQVDRRFVEIDRRFAEVDRRFEEIDTDIRELRGEVREMRRTMTQGFLGLGGIMVTGFVGLFTLIVVQI